MRNPNVRFFYLKIREKPREFISIIIIKISSIRFFPIEFNLLVRKFFVLDPQNKINTKQYTLREKSFQIFFKKA